MQLLVEFLTALDEQTQVFDVESIVSLVPQKSQVEVYTLRTVCITHAQESSDVMKASLTGQMMHSYLEFLTALLTQAQESSPMLKV